MHAFLSHTKITINPLPTITVKSMQSFPPHHCHPTPSHVKSLLSKIIFTDKSLFLHQKIAILEVHKIRRKTTHLCHFLKVLVETAKYEKITIIGNYAVFRAGLVIWSGK